ncbi:MAG: hypothetical protein FJ088_11070, partial [Deltaproteobacteria bacterium]|nr:hypothetical protein [Deltaproteobacteria bacterium]
DMFSQYVLPLVGTLFGINPSVVEELKKDYGAISHFITGTYKTPYFIVDTDGIATGKYPADDDESFKIDPITGNAIVGEDLVTFWCSIPKETSKSKQPFPLAFYSHGYTTNRLEFLGFCGRFARFGIAACGIDAAGHGIDVSEIDLYWSLIEPLLKELKVEEFFWGAVAGRARDLNNDGVPDSGGDFWTNDIFHTRDIVRQSVIDHIQMIRIARGFDGKRVSKFDYDGDGKNELLGDFDADGVPDFGGDAKVYYHFGQSMGGILGGILAGIEPALMAVAPSSGGGGLIDLGIRSSQGGVPEAVFMPMLGPLVSFNPEADGKVTLKFLVNDVNREKEVLFAYSDKIKPLDRIELVNLVNGEKDVIAAPADLKFRMGVAADAVDAATKRAIIGLTDESEVLPVPVTNTTDFGDALEIRIYDGEKGELKEVINKFLMDAEFQGAIYQKGTSLVALVTGYGLKRNSPEFRKFLQYAAMLVEPADPISYARHYFLDPLIFGYEHKLKSGSNALIVHSNGDMAVPVNTGVALARAAGIVDYSKNDICLDIVEKWGDAAYCSGEMAGCS